MFKYKYLIIIFFFLYITPLHSDTIIPRLRNDIVNLKDLSKLIGDGQLFVVFPQKEYMLKVRNTEEKELFETRFVSCMSIINESEDKVRNVITDYEHYSEFMPQNDKSEIIEKTQNHIITKYSVYLKLPVFKINATFDLKHQVDKKGDITWNLIRGKMKASLGKWETIPISKTKTLVINTSWSDHKSIGFFSRMLIKAQPDLAMAVPIGTAALMMKAVKKRAESIKAVNPKTSEDLPSSPQIPYISTQTIPVHTIKTLLKRGKLLIVHPRQWIKTPDEKPLDLVFTSSIGMINSPINIVKPVSTDITEYPKIFYQVKKAVQRNKKYEKEIDWSLKLWFSLFSFKINLTNNYFWESDNILTFNREAGNLEYVFGRREWISIEPEKTLIVFTTAFNGGKSAPLLFSFVNMLPNSQVIGSTSVCSVLMDKHIPWIEKKLGINKK